MKKEKCKKCNGRGYYQYDDMHSKVCEECCLHDNGWFELKEHYGKDNGKLCCMAGCGFVKDKKDRITVLEMKKELPMGVSAWKDMGKKWGYWDFYIKEIEGSQRSYLDNKIPKKKLCKYTDKELTFVIQFATCELNAWQDTIALMKDEQNKRKISKKK